MPAYNADKYVGQAIDAVLQQTYPAIELIIVNDGSTDNTGQILDTITDSRVKIIHQDNKGQSAAANTAFNASTGELIKFMDADDIISTDYIEKQVNRLGARRDAVVSAAWGRFYNDDLATFKLSREEVWHDLPADEWLVQSWRNGSSMMQCALWLIPRVILLQSGLWDDSLSLVNDFDFFTRVLLNSKEVLFEEDAILYYRSGIRGSLSDHKSAKAIDSAYRSIDQGTKNLSMVRSDRAARIACANTWQQLAYSLFPDHPELLALAEERIHYFGGSDIKYAKGGWAGALLTVLNWKTVKSLKSLLRR